MEALALTRCPVYGERAMQADVIVPVYRDTAMTVRCLQSVLEHGGASLRSLIVVADVSPEPDMREALASLSLSDGRMRVIHNEQNMGFVATCNRGLAERRGDAVLLNNDTIVTSGWLCELAAVVHFDDHTACASPLSNNATFFSVPEFPVETPADRVDSELVRAACAGLPRWTEMPTAHGFCLYMRGEALDSVGHLDPIFSPGYEEENDWVMRAQAKGLVAKRANRAFVYHLGSQSFRKDRLELQARNALILERRHPHYRDQGERSFFSLDARLAAHAVRVQSTGKVRVALDLRHLPRNQANTADDTLGLARGLAALPEIDLTMIVHEAGQAADVPGRIVSGDESLLDVEIIHRPAQVFDPTELGLLFRSPAHVIVSYPDLNVYRAQAVFGNQDVANCYRAMSALVLSAAQMTITVSEEARREIVAEFGLPIEEVAVIPLRAAFDESNEVADGSLRDQGPKRAAQLRWEQTARLTLAAYRSAIIRPFERSLRARRLMHDVISSWSAGGYYARSDLGPGLRKSWRDLNRALQVRVRREFGRFGFNTGKRSG
jgi:GT2 family glycosyltransferase